MTGTRIAKFAAGLLVAGLFVWLTLRQADLPAIGRTLAAARFGWVALAVAVFLAGYGFRGERWRLMLRHDNPGLRWRDCAGPLMASVAANNVLPLRAGDAVRAFGFNRRLGITATTSLTTLLVERLLDLLMLLAMLGMAVVVLGARISRLVGGGGWVFVAASIAILGLLLFPRLFEPLARMAVAAVSRVAPGIGARLDALRGSVFAALDHMAQGHVAGRLLACSLVAWVLEGLVYVCVAQAIPAIGRPAAAWLALSVGTLATMLPGTPGFIGTFDYFVVLSMQSLGNAAAACLAFAVLVHAVLWLPATLVGGLAWLAMSLHPQAER